MPAADPALLLRQGLARLEVPEPGRAERLLGSYMAELGRWNARFGLVKYGDAAELVVKHVLDSLSAWCVVRDLLPAGAGSVIGTVLDVGSGAGLPGIPLAIALPEASFTLLERMARRAAFLKTCAVLLGLSNVRVEQKDVADIGGDFDVVTFRAVAPLERLLPQLEGVQWRAVVAYKGREERAREEIEAVRRSAAGRYALELRPVRTPFLDEERCVAVVSLPPQAGRRSSLLTNG